MSNRDPNRRAGTGWTVLAVTACLALLGACAGSSGDEASPGTSGGTSPMPPLAVDGCDDAAVVDPADLSPDRPTARCDADAPPPIPLPERRSVTVANLFRGEHVAPLLLAEALGEFDKENLDVEIVPLGLADAVPQMATGAVQVAFGSPDAVLFNAYDAGIEVVWTIGNFSPPSAGDLSVPQTGLWARSNRFSDPSNPDLAELGGTKLASAVALGNIIDYPIAEAFEGSGITISDLEVTQIPSPDMVQALRSGAVDSAWLLDPFWDELASDPAYQLVVTQPAKETLGGAFMSKEFVAQDREVAVAFTRALIRTINTYLRDDYQSDPDVVAALADAMDATESSILGTPSLRFDWEIRQGTTTRAQEHYLASGVLDGGSSIPEDAIVDRSLYLEAVGRSGSVGG